MSLLSSVLMAVVFLGRFFAHGVLAQVLVEERGVSGMSRQMAAAVRAYEKGKDTEAMDLLMEVMLHGPPAERAVANDYLNRVTHRMNSSAVMETPPAPAVPEARFPAPPPPPEDLAPGFSPAEPRRSGAEPSPVPRRAEAPAPAPVPAASADARQAVRAKLRVIAAQYLSALQSSQGVRVLQQDKRPRAVGIPAGKFFESGTIFKKQAAGLLRSLTGILFALGDAEVTMFPEGAEKGESRVLDMRRVMALSAHFFGSGLTQSRVKADLAQTPSDLPQELAGFKGIILVFAYPAEHRLSMESGIGQAELQMSLGVFPDAIDPSRDEGAIVEWAVLESRVQPKAWKLQIFRPVPGQDPVLVQEMPGAGPAFHQIYWNGKKSSGAEAYPAGSYELILTAADAKDKLRRIHRWLKLGSAARLEEAREEIVPAKRLGPAVKAKPRKKNKSH